MKLILIEINNNISADKNNNIILPVETQNQMQISQNEINNSNKKLN